MLDISRNRVPTMDWLKELIDVLSLLRYNELQLYTEHTFAYADHATVWKHASPNSPIAWHFLIPYLTPCPFKLKRHCYQP